MLISFFRYLQGYVRVRLTGYSPERFLNLCKAHGIEIWDLQIHGLNYDMNVSIRDFRRLKPFRKKSRARLHILERHGLPFFAPLPEPENVSSGNPALHRFFAHHVFVYLEYSH